MSGRLRGGRGGGDDASSTLSSIISSSTAPPTSTTSMLSTVTAASATMSSSPAATDTLACNALENTPVVPIVGKTYFKGLMLIISAICVGIVAILALVWVLRHAFQCTNLIQQKLIIRILWVPVCFVVFAMGAVAVYPAADFLLAWPRLYESLGTVALYQLLLELAVPGDRHDREAFFAAMPHKSKPSGKLKSQKGSLGWWRGINMRVYQFPVVNLILFLVTEAISAKYCPTSRPGRIGKTIVGVGIAVSTGIVVVGIIRFYRRMSDELKPQGGLSKLITFKVILKVTVLQLMLMSIIETAGAIVPTSTVSYNDYVNGLPNWLTCMEMLLFIGPYLWAFRVSPYKSGDQSPADAGAAREKGALSAGEKYFFLRPLWEALFIWDVVIETLSAFRHCCSARPSKRARLPGKAVDDGSPHSGVHYPVPAAAPTGPAHRGMAYGGAAHGAGAPPAETPTPLGSNAPADYGAPSNPHAGAPPPPPATGGYTAYSQPGRY